MTLVECSSGFLHPNSTFPVHENAGQTLLLSGGSLIFERQHLCIRVGIIFTS